MPESLSQQEAVGRTQDLISEFLKEMGVEARISPRISMDDKGEITVFVLRTRNANLLIGQGGSNLLALQHVLRLFVRARLGEEFPEGFDFSIDVNNYRQEREKYLCRLADETVSRVRDKKEAVELKPMSSYERRVIHMHLSNETDITTESAGGGRDRRVVVKPLFTEEEGPVVSKSLVF